MTSKISNKIRKLLALGERAGTEAEAQAAMSAAHRLLAEYNLDMDDVIASGEEKPEDLITDDSTLSSLRNTYPVDNIYGAISRLYFCETFFRTSRSVNQRFYCIIGKPSNIAIVKYIADYVVNTMNELAQVEGKKQRQTMADEGITLDLRHWRMSFKVGFSHRIVKRVKEEIDKAVAGKITTSDGRALALLPVYEKSKKEIAEYQARTVGKLTSYRRNIAVRSTSGYQAGQSAANSVNLFANTIGSEQSKGIA